MTQKIRKHAPIPDKSPAEVLKKEGVKLGNLSLHSLLYTDDLAILEGLTCKRVWCASWSHHVNSQKSAIIHFQPKTHQALYTEMKVRDQTFSSLQKHIMA